MFTTIFWKKVWIWIKNYWYVPVIFILLFLCPFIAWRNKKLIKMFEITKESYEEQIKLLDERIGSIYLSYQNEIGLFFKKEYSKTMIANYVLKIFMKKNPEQQYFVNINPRNKKSIKFFTKNGFKILQHTYKLEID